MKKILIVCVNYDSYDHLTKYLNSIDNAKKKCSECILDIYIADNSSKKQELNIDKYQSINIKIYPFENLGYLGGASAIINNEIENILIYDFVIISNVDLLVEDNIFIKMLNFTADNDVAWIAPQIYSEKEKRDRNPKILTRFSKNKLHIIKIFYKFPFLLFAYKKTIYKRKRKQITNIQSQIYAGHGSFVLLTKAFFQQYKKIDYPIFLFGEEIFFAELIKNVNLKVIYWPEIKIFDFDHVSTNKMNTKLYSRENYKAVKYLLKTFYE